MVVQDALRTDLVSTPLKSDKKHRLKQRFDVQRKLGQGTYGKVQLAVNRETGQEVAIKTIKKNKIGNDQDLVRIRREIQIMSSIQHPHITHIYEVFENKDKIVLVMQFASGGELYDYLSEKKVLSDLEARRIFRQIAAAVYYCHKNKICHRDLKLENILLDEKGNAKIADFGLSNVFDEKHLLNTSCGSPLYASPEIVLGLAYYGPEVDCWSMGVLLYTLVYGAMPFDGSNFKKLVLQISEGDYFEPKKKSNASELIHWLLTVNPSKRATIVDICSDRWVNQGYEHSLLQVAEDMANLTPVRLDLLLALAPEADPIPPHQEEEEDQQEEEEEEDNNPDTAANSFAFVKGSRASHLSISQPDLQQAVDDSEDDFLPADIAAMEEFGSNVEKIASLARMDSLDDEPLKTKTSDSRISEKAISPSPRIEKNNNDVELPEAKTVGVVKDVSLIVEKEPLKKCPTKNTELAVVSNRKESLTPQDEKPESKKFVRPPGKIIIPKTFDSPQTTPSPKVIAPAKTLTKSDSKVETDKVKPSSPGIVKEAEPTRTTPAQDVNKNWIEPEKDDKGNEITDEKKNIAKGILKKGIAKAKLAERKMSKQGSTDSDTACSTPPATASGTPDPKPSFFKTPRPYAKSEEVATVTSQAEIKLSPTQSTVKSESPSSISAPLWDNRSQDSNWREQMEESLRRLSPEGDRYALSRVEDEKPLVPIARSYKKFTFTKDGACITETKKVYATPGADGSWTKVEKKTKITTRPGNAEEFERFRDMHMRTDTPSVTRSDSQSSSGSNDVYDDIFDSWTGDTMMCNMRKMNNMFQKFSRDPFLRRERRKNPFRFFRRTDSDRTDREPRSARSSDRGASENEEDYDVHYDDNSAVVYGSQGLWQMLRSANRGFPGRVTVQHEPIAGHARSASQDRTESKFDEWKRTGSRASSGYNTGTRSQSRDRTESPREKVLRFVFESPREKSFSRSPTRNEKWRSRHNPRRDSGVGSDGYESEYSIRHSPSDEMSRTGRVSSISSMCSDKQSMIRNFMRSWSKDYMSPPVSPASLGSTKDQPESLSESRRNRVEQWLEKGPLRVGRDSASNTPYGTVRPREYFHYNRSSSDKLAEGFFSTFDDDNPRRRTQSVHKDSPQMRFRTSTYSPVSEESLRDGHSTYQSDGSQSGSSVHRINFTFSDGRTASSPQNTRYVRQFSTSRDGCITVESSPPTSEVSRQPVVQMRVSINRGGNQAMSPPPSISRSGNQAMSPPPSISRGGNQAMSPPPSKTSLWDQQCTSVNRSPSPVPGIRQFSTEVQHCVGTPEATVNLQQCDSDKKTPSSGKSGLFKTSIWDTACSSMDAANINQHVHERHYSSLCDSGSKDFVPVSSNLHLGSNGANTPDSLEDLTAGQSVNLMATKMMSSNPRVSPSGLSPNVLSPELNPSILMPTNVKSRSAANSRVSPGSSSDGISEDLKPSTLMAATIMNVKLSPSSSSNSDTDFRSSEVKPVGLMTTKIMNCSMNATNARVSPSSSPNGWSSMEIKPATLMTTNMMCRSMNARVSSSSSSSPDNLSMEVKPPTLTTTNSANRSVNVRVNSSTSSSPDNLSVEVKPLGVLWNSQTSTVDTPCFVHPRPSSVHSDLGQDELQRKCLEKTTPGVGSVWNQRHTFDLLKNLLSDDGLESFGSSKCVVSSPSRVANENDSLDPDLSVIDNLELECFQTQSDKFHRMPSLMDDLQSPKEVLRQAMKICDSMEKCK